MTRKEAKSLAAALGSARYDMLIEATLTDDMAVAVEKALDNAVIRVADKINLTTKKAFSVEEFKQACGFRPDWEKHMKPVPPHK